MLASQTAYAVPTPELQAGQNVTSLSATDLASLAPFTQFARAAYCPTDILQDWNCGDACSANPDFQVTLVGGDSNAVQIFFVGFSPSQNSIIVVHKGTDPTQLMSDLTDADILMGSLDPNLFPGIFSSVQVHQGFRDEHTLTASAILAEVRRLMSVKNTKNIAIVGHSLGGALSELDSLFLTLNLPSASIKAITYGTPRVGNPAFAQLIDTKVPNFRRINNELDIVPIVPGRFLGFSHPHGEVHILSPGNFAVSCPGDDDATDSQCTISSVPNIFEGDLLNHVRIAAFTAPATSSERLIVLISWGHMREYPLAPFSARKVLYGVASEFVRSQAMCLALIGLVVGDCLCPEKASVKLRRIPK